MLHCCESRTIYCHIKPILKITVLNGARVGWDPARGEGKCLPVVFPGKAVCLPPAPGLLLHWENPTSASASRSWGHPPFPTTFPFPLTDFKETKPEIISRCLTSFLLPCRASAGSAYNSRTQILAFRKRTLPQAPGLSIYIAVSLGWGCWSLQGYVVSLSTQTPPILCLCATKLQEPAGRERFA